MNSESDFPISHLLLSEFRLIVEDAFKLIDCVSGYNQTFKIIEKTNDNFTDTGNMLVFQIFSAYTETFLNVQFDHNSHIIKQCMCLFIDEEVKLKTVGDLLDYIFWSACPCLCLVRSMMYMIEICKKGMSPREVDNQIQVLIDDDDAIGLTFRIQSDKNFLNLKLSEDLSNLVCFVNGNTQDTQKLPTITLRHDVCCLETSFAYSKSKNLVPHPQISESMRVIFGLLEIDFVLKLLESRQRSIELSDASGDEGEPIQDPKNHDTGKRNLQMG